MIKKAFVVYVDDGKSVFKLHIPAENSAKAFEYARGNGEIILCKLDEYRNPDSPISLDYISQSLTAFHFGSAEIDLILRALGDCEFIV